MAKQICKWSVTCVMKSQQIAQNDPGQANFCTQVVKQKDEAKTDVLYFLFNSKKLNLNIYKLADLMPC